jgi:hypothetical protein
MPLLLWAVIRILRAGTATARLLLDRRTLRALPWPYIRRLVRHDRWIRLVTVTTAATLVGIVLLLAPFASVRAVGLLLAVAAGGVGILSSLARGMERRRRV